MRFNSIVDYATEYLEKRIIRGELPPGYQIKEEEFSSKLKISRPPIREAFKNLEGKGLIERKPRRGVFVSEITVKDIWEIYTIKMAIYSMSAKLGTEKITNQEIKRLEKIVQGMNECTLRNPPDIMRYQDLNYAFHKVMIDAIQNGRMKTIIESLNLQVNRVSFKSLLHKKYLLSSYRYHKEILKAIKKKDIDLVVRLNEEHISKGLEFQQRFSDIERE